MADMVCKDCGGAMVDGKCEDCGSTKGIPAPLAKKVGAAPPAEGGPAPAAKKSPMAKWMGGGKFGG